MLSLCFIFKSFTNAIARWTLKNRFFWCIIHPHTCRLRCARTILVAKCPSAMSVSISRIIEPSSHPKIFATCKLAKLAKGAHTVTYLYVDSMCMYICYLYCRHVQSTRKLRSAFTRTVVVVIRQNLTMVEVRRNTAIACNAVVVRVATRTALLHCAVLHCAVLWCGVLAMCIALSVHGRPWLGYSRGVGAPLLLLLTCAQY